MCGFIAQLVEHSIGITEVTVSNPVEATFFQASSFQLLKLENLLRCSLFTFKSHIVGACKLNYQKHRGQRRKRIYFFYIY